MNYLFFNKSGTFYTQSQKKHNFSSGIFPGAQGQGHLHIGFLNNFQMPPYSLVYTLLQKKGNFKNVAILLRLSVEEILTFSRGLLGSCSCFTPYGKI